MNNIVIHADCTYSHLTVSYLVEELSFEDQELNVAIYVFENKHLKKKDVKMLLESDATRILVIANKTIISFLSATLPRVNVIYESYNIKISSLKSILRLLLISKVMNYEKFLTLSQKKKRLTKTEMIILRLYLKGISLTNIAQYLNRDIRTVSAQKKAAMMKIGVENNTELVNYRFLYFFDLTN